MVCVILVKTRLDSLGDCIWWERPENKDKIRC